MKKTQNNVDMQIQANGAVRVVYNDIEYWYADEATAYVAGRTYRVDGPCKIWGPVGEFWNTNKDLDGLHREDGPAAIYVSGRKEWWVDGKLIKVEVASSEVTSVK